MLKYRVVGRVNDLIECCEKDARCVQEKDLLGRRPMTPFSHEQFLQSSRFFPFTRLCGKPNRCTEYGGGRINAASHSFTEANPILTWMARVNWGVLRLGVVVGDGGQAQ